MKNILTTLGLLVGLSLNAATLSQVFTNNSFTNVTGLSPRPTVVTQLLIANTNASAVQLAFYDTVTNQLVTTNLAFTNTLTYLTNSTNSITNYYGVTNYFTNIVIVDNTNNFNAATTNTLAPKLVIEVGANTSYKADAVNYYFLYGLWVSNSAPSNATVSVTFR